MKANHVAADARVTADRRAAGAVEHRQERTFGSERSRGVGIVDRAYQRAGLGVVLARFDADRALTDSRHEFVGIKKRRRRGEQIKPLQAGDSKNGGVEISGFELAQPRFDIAAQRHDFQIRPQMLDQRLAPRRRGADHGAAGQIARAFWRLDLLFLR